LRFITVEFINSTRFALPMQIKAAWLRGRFIRLDCQVRICLSYPFGDCGVPSMPLGVALRIKSEWNCVMSNRKPAGFVSSLLRFYHFALPHWKMITVALLAMFMYSLTWSGLLLLVKPVMEGLIVIGSTQGQESIQNPAPQERLFSESPENITEDAGLRGPSGAIEKFKQGLTRRLQQVSVVRKLLDYLRPGPHSLKRVAVLIICITPLIFIATFLRIYAQGYVAWSVLADLRTTIFQKLTGLSLGFFNEQRGGELISRLTNDIATARRAVDILFGDLLLHPMKLLMFAAIALWYSRELFLLTCVSLPILVLILGKYGGRIRKHSRKSLERLADITEAISQMFSGIRVVKAFGMEEEENAEFRHKNRLQLKQAFKLVRNRAWAGALPELMMAFAFGGMLIFANYLLGIGRLTVPDLALFAAASFAMTSPVKHLVKCYTLLQQSLGAMERIFGLLDVEVQIQDAPDAVELDGVKHGIRYNNVWFAYDEKPVLKQINLFVPAGKVYAIVGETGAGKSTMLDLLPRFYDPQKGSIEIDNIDIRKIKRQSLLDNIAIVGQHPFLFNRSIAENIRYGKRDATDEEVVAAARAAQMHDFVKTLPHGYDTPVGDRGSHLSGGQRQCLTMARAILKDAPILILDEATSSLDSESERAVQNALKNLMRGRTTFIIAHRLSTVRHADRIIVLKDGRIVEQGTHDELIELKGEYEKLYRLQFSEPEDAPDSGG